MQRGAQEIGVADAGDFHRILEREEEPVAGAFVGFHAEDVSPSRRTSPFVTV